MLKTINVIVSRYLMLLADQRQLKYLVSVMSSVPGMVDGLHDNSRGRPPDHSHLRIQVTLVSGAGSGDSGPVGGG